MKPLGKIYCLTVLTKLIAVVFCKNGSVFMSNMLENLMLTIAVVSFEHLDPELTQKIKCLSADYIVVTYFCHASLRVE